MSSEYSVQWGGQYGRLQNRLRCWLAKRNNYFQWFQVDFGRPSRIIKVETQGRPDANQWVTRYLLQYSQDSVYWTVYKYAGKDKVF